MKTTVLGLMLGAVVTGIALLGLGQRNEVFAQRGIGQGGAGHEAQGDLITLTATVADNRQQLTVIDPRTRVMSIYHIEPTTGTITLKSVRNINWDLQMVEFNGVNPLPREIKALLESR